MEDGHWRTCPFLLLARHCLNSRKRRLRPTWVQLVGLKFQGSRSLIFAYGWPVATVSKVALRWAKGSTLLIFAVAIPRQAAQDERVSDLLCIGDLVHAF